MKNTATNKDLVDIQDKLEKLQDSIYLNETPSGDRNVRMAELNIHRAGMFATNIREVIEPIKDLLAAMIARMMHKHCGEKEMNRLQLKIVSRVRQGGRLSMNPTVSAEDLLIIQRELFGDGR